VHKQVELGLRWLTCGTRLYRRNPWQLAVLGLIGAAATAALSAIPLIGALLAGFLFPAWLAVLYAALDATVQSSRPLAPAAAIRSAPAVLARVLGDEGRLLQIVVLSLGALAVVLIAAMLASVVAGGGWWVSSAPGLLLYARAGAAVVLAAAVCAVGAAGIAYALPLALLRRQALLDAVRASVRAALRHPWALAVLAGLALAPLVLAAALWSWSPVLARAGALAAAALVLPLVAAGLYCSYRTLFPLPAARPAAAPPPAARAVRRA
jgi:hypothetical protein